jgi:hypothetical protein
MHRECECEFVFVFVFVFVADLEGTACKGSLEGKTQQGALKLEYK